MLKIRLSEKVGQQAVSRDQGRWKQANWNLKLLSDAGVTIGLRADSGAVLIGRWQAT